MRAISSTIAILLLWSCVIASPAPAPAPSPLKRQLTLSLPIIGSITLGNNQGSVQSFLTSTYYSTITTTTTTTTGPSTDLVSVSSPSSTPVPTTGSASSSSSSSPPSSSNQHKSSTHSHVSSASAAPSVIIVTQTIQVVVTASAPIITSSSLNLTSTTASLSSTFSLMPNTAVANNGYQSVSSSSTSAIAVPTSESRQDNTTAGYSSRTTAGIAVGSIVGGIGALGALIFVAFRYKRRHIPADTDDETWYPAPSPEMEQSHAYTYASPSASLGRRLSATLGLKSNAAPPPTSDIEANPAAAAWWAAATAASSSSSAPAHRPKSPFDDDAASIGNQSDDTVRPRTPTSLFGFARRTSQQGHSHSSQLQNNGNPRPNSPSTDWDPFRSALDNYHVGRQ